jgi:FixJ family two-component response regulator
MNSTFTAPVESAEITARNAFMVCVVDDEPAMVEMLLASLRSLGYDAIGTADPLEALAHVKSGRCRVLISDIKMPTMDGHDLLDQALKVDPAVNVILITGYCSLDSAVDAIRRGAADYLSKPVDRERLNKTLDEIGVVFSCRQRIRELEGQALKGERLTLKVIRRNPEGVQESTEALPFRVAWVVREDSLWVVGAELAPGRSALGSQISGKTSGQVMIAAIPLCP